MQTTTRPGADPEADDTHIGDEILIVRDALLEIQTDRRAPRTWVFVAHGTLARLVARHDGVRRIVLGSGQHARSVAFVGDHTMTRRRPPVSMH